MGGLGGQLILTTLVVAALAGGGIAVGLGERAARRVRALAASALLLTIMGYGVLVVAGQLSDANVASTLSFLALCGGVVLGALVAILACAAGLALVARADHLRWQRVLLLGSLLPLVLCVSLVTADRAAWSRDPSQITRHEIVILLLAMALAALVPVLPLIYSTWVARQEADDLPISSLPAVDGWYQ
jgi:hypothetical protein